MRIPSAHDGVENRIPLAVLPQNYGNHVTSLGHIKQPGFKQKMLHTWDDV